MEWSEWLGLQQALFSSLPSFTAVVWAGCCSLATSLATSCLFHPCWTPTVYSHPLWWGTDFRSSERDCLGCPLARHASMALDHQHHSNFSETVWQQIIKNLKDLAGSSTETLSVPSYSHHGEKTRHWEKISLSQIPRTQIWELNESNGFVFVSLSEPLATFLVQKLIWCSDLCKMGSLQLHCFPDIQPRLFLGRVCSFFKPVMMLIWAVLLALLSVFPSVAAHLWMRAASMHAAAFCPWEATFCLRLELALFHYPSSFFEAFYLASSACTHHTEIQDYR